MELYVYYRVPLGHRDAACAEVAEAQRALAVRWPGLEGRLLCRTEDTGDTLTCMETYRREPPLQPADCDAIERAMTTLPSHRSGPRHVERFEPLAR